MFTFPCTFSLFFFFYNFGFFKIFYTNYLFHCGNEFSNFHSFLVLLAFSEVES